MYDKPHMLLVRGGGEREQAFVFAAKKGDIGILAGLVRVCVTVLERNGCLNKMVRKICAIDYGAGVLHVVFLNEIHSRCVVFFCDDFYNGLLMFLRLGFVTRVYIWVVRILLCPKSSCT